MLEASALRAYLVAMDAMIAPAEIAITNQNKRVPRDPVDRATAAG